jgi:hypothetical protein
MKVSQSFRGFPKMSRRKISLNEIGSLFAEGKGVSEIAKKTGFTKGAISKALKS